MPSAHPPMGAGSLPPSNRKTTLKIIDTITGGILDTIPVTGTPNECAATPDGRYVGVPIRDGEQRGYRRYGAERRW